MKVPDLDISWFHKYTSDDIVEVPGFNASVLVLPISARVYVQVSLTPNGDELKLTVSIYSIDDIMVTDKRQFIPSLSSATFILALWSKSD